MTDANDVLTALRRYYGLAASVEPANNEWALLDELALKSRGWSYGRIDAFVVRGWSGKPLGHERHAIEIKVTRADLLHELANPAKRSAAMLLAHRFYFATPTGLIRDGELPNDCGLLEVHPSGVRVKVTAPRRDVPDIPADHVATIFRRASTAEERLRRGALAGDQAAEIARLTLELRDAEKREAAAKAALQPYKRRLNALRGFLRRIAGATCGDCGKPIKANTSRAYGWEHVGPTQGAGGCFNPWPLEDLAELHGTTIRELLDERGIEAPA